MALAQGSRLGPYEILAPLGAGGMGEVYRAKDTKLGRDVAIKILPEIFVRDPERVARFGREAQLLAALNHPHIAAIYGLEEAEGSKFLVLELVEGETLAEKLAHGSGLMADGSVAGKPSALTPQPSIGLPLAEALSIARQIADALAAAHDKGIIHRDLKPANIALTADGQVKILDFGLAKFDSSASLSGERGDLSHSPTLTFAATEAGVILGTAAYMSPEQARGRVADKRTDVWSFGCVLYEMLTGRRAFEGEDATDTIAAIVRGEPDWTALPKNVPPVIRAIAQRCLVKDRMQRLPDISVALFLMNEPAIVPATAAGAGTARSGRRVAAVAAASAIVAAVLTAAVSPSVMRSMSPSVLRVSRFAIVPPPAVPLAIQGADRDIAISPDGTHVVYRAGTGLPQLVVRALDQLDAQPPAGITGPRAPFISPDGHWIGFFAGGEIKKVSINGGPPISLCRHSNTPRGASWGPDDTIVFATSDPSTGLLSVPAGGGEPKVLTKPDAAHGEGDHLFPSILPGGRSVLFTISSPGQAENSQVAVFDLKTGQSKTLVRGGSHAEYVDTGHLIYAAAGTLRAVRFDVGRLEVRSDPVPIVEQVMTAPSGAANFAVSRGGTLVFVPGGAGAQGVTRSLVWVTRQGREEPIKVAPRAYAALRLSPDGARVALQISDQANDIWTLELARQTLTRLTFDPGFDMSPVWTPDGRRIIFASARAGVPNLYWHAADGTGADERLTTSPDPQFPTSISPDGLRVILYDVGPKTQPDIALVTLEGPPTSLGTGPSTALGLRQAEAATSPSSGGAAPSTSLGTSQRHAETLIQTAFVELKGEVSPDGRWIAYQSNESSHFEVYVRPFPKVDGGRWQVSTGGGTRPAWARSGRELFYLDAANALMAVPVQTTGSTFSAGNSAKVFDARYYPGPGFRAYDVSPDGQRFLMIKDAASDQPPTATPASMVVVLNWFEELKARAPASK